MLRPKRFQLLQLQAPRCYATRVFSSCSCRPPDVTPHVFSAAAAAGHQMLRHKHVQQLQLQATRCHAQSEKRPPATAAGHQVLCHKRFQQSQATKHYV